MTSPLKFLCLLVPSALGSQGLPDDSAATHKYVPALRLEARLNMDSIAPEDTAVVKYTLINTGTRSLRLCVGQGHGVELIAGADTARPFVLIDHETCAKEEKVQPGQRLVWTWPFVVPQLRPGVPATFEAWADIVDPTDCGIFGCARAIVSSSPLSVNLKSR